jgi:hypothetical protein
VAIGDSDRDTNRGCLYTDLRGFRWTRWRTGRMGG